MKRTYFYIMTDGKKPLRVSGYLLSSGFGSYGIYNRGSARSPWWVITELSTGLSVGIEARTIKEACAQLSAERDAFISARLEAMPNANELRDIIRKAETDGAGVCYNIRIYANAYGVTRAEFINTENGEILVDVCAEHIEAQKRVIIEQNPAVTFCGDEYHTETTEEAPTEEAPAEEPTRSEAQGDAETVRANAEDTASANASPHGRNACPRCLC
jgi:hypothetical protein